MEIYNINTNINTNKTNKPNKRKIIKPKIKNYLDLSSNNFNTVKIKILNTEGLFIINNVECSMDEYGEYNITLNCITNNFKHINSQKIKNNGGI